MRLHRTTGLDPEQLDELVARCFQHQKAQNSATWKRAGRPAALSFYRAIAVTVAYIRQNIVQEVLAEIFNTSQPSISRAITAMTPIIATALQVCVPDLAEAIRGEVTLVDGSLLPCWSWRKHPELYSGKHHTTGHNVQVVASLEGRVLHISDPLPGKTHDITALRQHGLDAALDLSNTITDKGYQGLPDAITPIKKPRGGELDEHDRAINHDINSLRAAVELANAHIKNWKILHTDYRRPLKTFNKTLDAVRGLIFFTMDFE